MYVCFCGRGVNPHTPNDEELTPHSCGEPHSCLRSSLDAIAASQNSKRTEILVWTQSLAAIRYAIRNCLVGTYARSSVTMESAHLARFLLRSSVVVGHTHKIVTAAIRNWWKSSVASSIPEGEGRRSQTGGADKFHNSQSILLLLLLCAHKIIVCL